MKDDYENALHNGANDYLSKPVNEEKLFAMLKIWLYKK
jgi:YesN/AraC family two-component response regulator